MAVVSPRVSAALFIAAMLAMLTGFALGEYEFQGAMPFVAAVLLALVLSEIVVSVGKARSWLVGGFVAICVAAALVLGGHLDANGVEPVKTGAYLAAALGAVISVLRAGPALRPSSPPSAPARTPRTD